MKRIETVKLFLALAALASLGACAAADRSFEEPSYYVMRHLQKADGSDPGLTEAGRRNAAYLPAMPAFSRSPPRAIYASATRRARETAQPAADRFGIPIRDYDPRDTPALIARVKKERGPVLIVGHSNTVPAIVEALGGGSIGPLGEDDYGMLYTLYPGKSFAARSLVDPEAPTHVD
ncbi:MAG TPA: phosphoglycerate mutase family protein [Allosphingosinicella sp.]|jgi:phosphohistidine phosphatase SixA